MSAEIKIVPVTQTVPERLPERQRKLSFALRQSAARKVLNAPSAPSATRQSATGLPVEIPPGHVGPVVLPGTGRLVWWTGRVAIGIRHQPAPRYDAVPQSALWVQELMLGPGHVAA